MFRGSGEHRSTSVEERVTRYLAEISACLPGLTRTYDPYMKNTNLNLAIPPQTTEIRLPRILGNCIQYYSFVPVQRVLLFLENNARNG